MNYEIISMNYEIISMNITVNLRELFNSYFSKFRKKYAPLGSRLAKIRDFL